MSKQIFKNKFSRIGIYMQWFHISAAWASSCKMHHTLLFFFQLPVTTTFFQGSLEDIKFDDDPVGLWNFVDAENNLRGELAR